MFGSGAKKPDPVFAGSEALLTQVQSRGVKSGDAAVRLAVQVAVGSLSKSKDAMGSVDPGRGGGAAQRRQGRIEQRREVAEGGRRPQLHRRDHRRHLRAVGCGDGLAGRTAGERRERLPDEVRARRLERVRVVGEVAVLDLVDSLRAEVDVRRLGEADRRDGLAVVGPAVDEQRVAVVGDAGVGVHAAAVRRAADVEGGVADLAGVRVAGRVPHVADRAVERRWRPRP